MKRQGNIVSFDWTLSVLEKIETKHGLSPKEVEETLFGEIHVQRGPAGLYYLYGRSAAGRYIFIVYRYLGAGVAGPVTARDMNRAEKKLYVRSI